MIKYKLKCKSKYCTEKNEFDGWFQNFEAFESQMATGLITCPICGSNEIIKLLATPNVRKLNPQTSENLKYKNSGVTNSEKSYFVNENITTMLRTIKREIQKNSTFVGDEFVSKARSMKEGKIKDTPIHGHGTNKEVQELRDEGIDVVSIPWVSEDH
tara:strand:+ start:200 stop:670 length:471 start_codon:yes stop_codon:yes gene_type:complete